MVTTIRLLSSIRIYTVYIYFNIKVEMHQSYRKATGYGLGGIAMKVRRYFQMMQSVAACTGNLKSCNNQYHHTMIIVESHV